MFLPDLLEKKKDPKKMALAHSHAHKISRSHAHTRTRSHTHIELQIRMEIKHKTQIVHETRKRQWNSPMNKRQLLFPDLLSHLVNGQTAIVFLHQRSNSSVRSQIHILLRELSDHTARREDPMLAIL